MSHLVIFKSSYPIPSENDSTIPVISFLENHISVGINATRFINFISSVFLNISRAINPGPKRIASKAMKIRMMLKTVMNLSIYLVIPTLSVS